MLKFCLSEIVIELVLISRLRFSSRYLILLSFMNKLYF